MEFARDSMLGNIDAELQKGYRIKNRLGNRQ